MNCKSLSLWYLNNYIDKEKENIKLYDEENFDDFDVKVKICNEEGKYVHYLELADFNRTLLYGSAGCGKTYLLKRIFKNILCKSSNYCMYFDLRYYNGEELLDLICNRIECRELTRDVIKKLLCSGEILLIFDNYHGMNYINRVKINEKIFNNDKFKNIKYIIACEEKVYDMEFKSIYHVESLSSREVYKKIIREYCRDDIEFKEAESYLKKFKLESFLYRPINLKYLLGVLDYEETISYIYRLKSENDLYLAYLEIMIGDEKIIKTLSYIAYYMTRKSMDKIKMHDLRVLSAEALRYAAKEYDVDEAVDIIKNTALIELESLKDTYSFEDKNLMMELVHEYIISNKIKTENIVHNEAFYKYFLWRCRIDASFMFENIFRFDDEFLYNMLKGIEDKKKDIFYPYIKLFFSEKPYDELKVKLNYIYQRFRWEDDIQEMTLKFLEELSTKRDDIERLMKNKAVCYICNNENIDNSYKILEKRWIEKSSSNELIKKVYLNIIKGDYVQEYKMNRKISRNEASIIK